jgi:hypothetical protein
MSGLRAYWRGSAPATNPMDEVQRAVVAYESIAQIVITPTQSSAAVKIGFGAR